MNVFIVASVCASVLLALCGIGWVCNWRSRGSQVQTLGIANPIASNIVVNHHPAPSTLKRVIVYSRHGIRTPSRKFDKGFPTHARMPSPMDLTARGYALARGMGRYYAAYYNSLLAACPRVSLVADTKERDEQTAAALLQDMVAVSYRIHESTRTHAMFHPTLAPPCTVPPTASKTAMQGYLGMSIDAFLHTSWFQFRQRKLVRMLQEAGHMVPPPLSSFASTEGQLEHTMALANLYSESFLLETENRPLPFDLVPQTDLRLLNEIHSVLREVNDRPFYLAQHKGSGVVARILEILTSPHSPSVYMIVGHDKDMGATASLLGLAWQLPGFAANQIPPASALVFEIHQHEDKPHEAGWVEVYMVSQTMSQMKELQMADTKAGRPLRVPVYIRSSSPFETLEQSHRFANSANSTTNRILLSDWEALINQRLLPSCVPQRH